MPYNIRYCVSNFKMDRQRLDECLPILSQINLDGNCYMIALVAMLFLLLSGTPTDWHTFCNIGFLVLFMSLGAPNLPGGFMLAMLIIINILKLPSFIPMAIYCEVFFGCILNLVNVIGDIVSVTVMFAHEDRKKQQGL